MFSFHTKEIETENSGGVVHVKKAQEIIISQYIWLCTKKSSMCECKLCVLFKKKMFQIGTSKLLFQVTQQLYWPKAAKSFYCGSSKMSMAAQKSSQLGDHWLVNRKS